MVKPISIEFIILKTVYEMGWTYGEWGCGIGSYMFLHTKKWILDGRK